MKTKLAMLAVVGVLLAGCGENGTYTLYRTSTVNNERVHMATFDAKEGDVYNRDNCEITKSLFEKQPGVQAKYWCEAGRYKASL